MKKATLQQKMKEMLLRRSKAFNPDGEAYNGHSMESQGLYAYDLKRLANT